MFTTVTSGVWRAAALVYLLLTFWNSVMEFHHLRIHVPDLRSPRARRIDLLR